MNSWKRIVLASASFGVGFAIAISAIWVCVVWYKSRPQPWIDTALKGHFEGLSFKTQPHEGSYVVEFLYNVENHSGRTYEFNPTNLAVLAVLTEGNALSKEAGEYQTSDTTIDGTDFIPAQGKARFRIRVSYQYPPTFTEKDKDDAEKVSKSVDRRLREISGFAIFDHVNHYRIDMPEGWKNWKDVKKSD
jgi:hypothetical protein